MLFVICQRIKVHQQTKKLINDRKTMFFETNKLDWGMAEHLAYGSLLQEGFDVRYLDKM
jgi:2-oxoglutarate dehydrogenase E1 component